MSILDRDSPRIDWHAIKDRIPIETVAVSLLGEPEGRSGSRGLWWPCPFHQDSNPSFHVSPEWGTWRCFGCDKGGDAADLVMGIEGLTFPQAAERLAEMFSLEGRNCSRAPAPPKPRTSLPRARADPAVDPVKALSRRQWAMRTALEAVERLWSPKGRKALEYLRNRGLTDATIGLARLGLVRNLKVLKADESGTYTATGITIPWFDDAGRIARINVRLAVPFRSKRGRETRYIDVFRDRPAVFAPFGVRDGWPLIVCEGEFDALLLAQELRGHADVVTLGSASGKLSDEAGPLLKGASGLFAAHDGDSAGAKAARRLREVFPQAERVRPPAPAKDWTDLHAGGFGMIACHWGRFIPLGSPPRAEDFADASLYKQAPDERDRIEAQMEREAIQAEGAETIEPIGQPPLQGEFEPETDDEAARLAAADESELEALGRIMASIPGGGFTRVDPVEFERQFVEFDPPVIDRPKPTGEPPLRERPRRARAEAMEPMLL